MDSISSTHHPSSELPGYYQQSAKRGLEESLFVQGHVSAFLSWCYNYLLLADFPLSFL
jgi:hypothetical protein